MRRESGRNSRLNRHGGNESSGVKKKKRKAANWREAPSICPSVFWFCFWSVVGVAAAVLAFVLADKKKTESAEEISNSIFGYKLLIPLIAFPFILSNGVLDGYYNEALLVTIGAAVAYTVYRRGVHYKKSDYIIVGTMLALSIISIFAKPIMQGLIKDVVHYGA